MTYINMMIIVYTLYERTSWAKITAFYCNNQWWKYHILW